MPWEVLKFLRQERCVSGEAISAALGISRAGVWKRIRLLREKGFDIRAVPSKGYLLYDVPDLSVEQIRAGVQGRLWQEVLYYEKADSTNELGASVRGPGGTVIIADSQNRGKGRLGRKWISPPGMNIYMSLVMQPRLASREAPLLTLLAAVSCAVGLAGATGLHVLIKWPNDLMADDKKIGGILTETRSDPDQLLQAVIGIGINVNMGKDAFPEEIRSLSTSLMIETGSRWRRSTVIMAILREFERGWRLLRESGRGQLLGQVRALSSTIGRDVAVTVGSRRMSGFAEGIDDDGLLILRLANGEVRHISAGDLSILR